MAYLSETISWELELALLDSSQTAIENVRALIFTL